MAEIECSCKAASVVLVRNDCSWDSGDGAGGKRSGRIRFLTFFVVSKCMKRQRKGIS